MKNPASGAGTFTPPDYFSTQVSRARRFYLNLNPAPRTDLAVVSGGVEHCTPDYAIGRKSFPFYAVEFVSQGGGRLKFKQAEHRLLPGSVFSYGPGVAHEISTDPHHPLTKYFVDFTGVRAAGWLRSCLLRSGTRSQVFPPSEIQPLFDELIRCGLRNTPQAPQICARLLEGLLLKVAESRAPLPGRETLAFTTYQRCRDYLLCHFLRLRTLEQIARECHVDNTYLCRLFKRYDHQTPYRLLMRLKMNYAAERLQMPGILAKQIAEETGFANPFHFSRAFKSVFSVSPRTLAKMR
ncbi:MAG TPA: AraC family transcriptional regulator [Verrucomicrobiae bacterium]|nr:AraC family transcriptional regulator [Verrucomicrobiae bacterium]